METNRPSSRPRRCPFGECDGSGFVIDEQARRARDCRCRPLQIARRRARAVRGALGGIPPRYRDASFDRYPLTMVDPEVVSVARSYAEQISERIAAGRGIWFFGGVGTGKTTLAMVVAKAALAKGHSVAIYSLPELLRVVRDAIGREGGVGDPLEALAAVDLLVIDDFGAQYSTPWAIEQVFLLVDGRYQHRRPIVTTSNLDPEELAEQLSRFRGDGLAPVGAERDPHQLGWRIVSRLVEICGDPLPLGDRDLRREYRPAGQGEVS